MMKMKMLVMFVSRNQTGDQDTNQSVFTVAKEKKERKMKNKVSSSPGNTHTPPLKIIVSDKSSDNNFVVKLSTVFF